jgi:excisionase family DNA binding protein
VNKKEAAEYLNVSERAIERYTAKGKLNVTYEKGRTGTVAIYDEAELKKIKAEMQKPAVPARSNSRDNGDKLARVTPSGLSLAQAIGQAIGERLLQPNGNVPAESKLTLTLKEAASLSGLSRSWLVGAIHNKKLKAAKRGRGWNVKRIDLDAYVRGL